GEIARRLFDARPAEAAEQPAAQGRRARPAGERVLSKRDEAADTPVAPAAAAPAGSSRGGVSAPAAATTPGGQMATLEGDAPAHPPTAPARSRWFVACGGLAAGAVITAGFYASRADHEAPLPAAMTSSTGVTPVNAATSSMDTHQEPPAPTREDV